MFSPSRLGCPGELFFLLVFYTQCPIRAQWARTKKGPLIREPQDLAGGPTLLFQVEGKMVDLAQCLPLWLRTGSHKRVSMEPAALGLNLFPGRTVTGGEETQKAAVQKTGLCTWVCVGQRMASAFALPPFQMQPSYEALRSVPAPPNHGCSPAPGSSHLPLSGEHHCVGGSNLLYPAPSCFPRGLTGTPLSLW